MSLRSTAVAGLWRQHGLAAVRGFAAALKNALHRCSVALFEDERVVVIEFFTALNVAQRIDKHATGIFQCFAIRFTCVIDPACIVTMGAAVNHSPVRQTKQKSVVDWSAVDSCAPERLLPAEPLALVFNNAFADENPAPREHPLAVDVRAADRIRRQLTRGPDLVFPCSAMEDSSAIDRRVRGHMAPAANMPNAQAMAQSFSLANMVPQAPLNNQKSWAGIEQATRKYVMRAKGDVYVITGPVFDDSSETIGLGRVRVPKYLYKLVYDTTSGRAWAHWIENADEARAGRPISYEALVRRTGIEFLPGLRVQG
jgi:hypothetical protein